LDGRTEGKKTTGKPKMMLDWMFDKKERVELSKCEGNGAR